MAFLVDEAHLPAILTVGPMTDEAFAQLCAEHPDLNLEMSAHGELIITQQTLHLDRSAEQRDRRSTRQLGTP
jgi:hypothetical protein